MSPENQNIDDRRSNPSFLRRVGETTLAIGAAYVGLKIGEELFNFALSYPLEIGIATAVGSTPINIRYGALESRNNPTE